MSKMITWIMEDQLPAPSPVEANSIFYAADVVRYMKFNSTFSIKYCLERSIRYLSGNQKIDVPAGSFFVVNEGSELECLPSEPGTQALMVFFTRDLLLDVQRTLGEDEKLLLDEPLPRASALDFFEQVYDSSNLIAAQLNRLSRQIASSRDPNPTLCPPDLFFSLAGNLFDHQCQISGQITSIRARKAPTRVELYRRLLCARIFMLDQWNMPLTLEEVARHACLSPFHFHRSFREAFGLPPMQWFRQLKLEKAKDLLAGCTISEVALQCGYADLAVFSKAFKKKWGFSPSQWKRHPVEDLFLCKS